MQKSTFGATARPEFPACPRCRRPSLRRSVGFSEVHLVVAAVVLGSGRPVFGREGGRGGAALQGESGGLGLGYVDSVPSQDNLQMRRN